MALRGVSFEYREDAGPLALPGEQVGFIAQEVQTVFPDWVEEGTDGRLYLAPKGMDALVVEALRDLRAEKDAELAALRAEKNAEIATLQDRLARLEALVERLASPASGTGPTKGGSR
jgi:hypothetical protein